MKLNFKICSPFFIVIAMFLFIACNEQTKSKPYVSALSVRDSTLLVRQLETAIYFQKKQDFVKAYFFYDQCLSLRIKARDTVGQAHALISMAGVQRISGDYFGSDESATEARTLLEKTNKKINTKYLAEVYNLIGMCSRKLLDFDRSIEIYRKAKKITTDSLAKCIVESNIASVYIDKKDYKTAFTILNKLKESDFVKKHPDTHARVLNNLGNVCNAINNPNALMYLQNGLTIRTQINDHKGIVASNIQLAHYFSDKNKSRSIQYAKKAYAMATALNVADERLEALKILINTSPQRDFALRYIAINDSLANARLSSKTEFASIKFEAKSIEAENLKLEARNAESKLQAQRDKTSKIILGAAIVIIVIFGFFAYKNQRLKHNRAKVREVHKAENRISKKIHDELANNVFETMMYTEALTFNAPDKKEVLMKRLDEMYKKTREISHENNSIDTGSNFYVSLVEMLAHYKTNGVNVLPANAEKVIWDKIEDHIKTALYLVLQELMVNMKKHSQATLVVIKFSGNSKNLKISYADNGVGIKKNIFFYKNGLHNAESRIKLIKGSLTFEDSTKGLKILIVIPI